MLHTITTDPVTIKVVYNKCLRDECFGCAFPETTSLKNICQTVLQNSTSNQIELELTDWELREWESKSFKPVRK